MNAAELRMGNYVGEIKKSGKKTVLEVVKVLTVTPYCINRMDLVLFDGIKLTEEWLVKMGFRREGMNYHNEFMDLYWSNSLSTYFFRYSTKKDRLVQVDTVHELQNLYWSLVGEELKIKE